MVMLKHICNLLMSFKEPLKETIIKESNSENSTKVCKYSNNSITHVQSIYRSLRRTTIAMWNKKYQCNLMAMLENKSLQIILKYLKLKIMRKQNV